MKETITQHKFNPFELELIGYLTGIIIDISKVEFNLCPIYNSLIDLSIKKKNNDLDRTEKSNEKYTIIDPYGFYTQNDLRKIKTIVISVGKINEEFNGVESKRMKTIVLIHEIGHYIAYNTTLFGEKKIMTSNPREFGKDTDFQELWAQAFTYKLFQSFTYSRSLNSDKSRSNAYKCMEEMSKLADKQPSKYRTFKTLFGEDDNSFSGNSYRNVDLEELFYRLFKTRNKNLWRGEYSEFFKNNF
tara:strand:- start:179 stop:910 length:732 start_codon:yes stop_codon:yes gene_type:complete